MWLKTHYIYCNQIKITLIKEDEAIPHLTTILNEHLGWNLDILQDERICRFETLILSKLITMAHGIPLGPLHKRAKSCDHEIVRAQKKSSKGCPKTPPKSCSVVTDPQVWCEVICDRVLNQMLFQWIFIHADPYTWSNRKNQQLWVFRVPWSPVLYKTYLQEVVFENKPSDHETWSIRCHVGIHVDFTSILHSRG
jgi:hypothetical protein